MIEIFNGKQANINQNKSLLKGSGAKRDLTLVPVSTLQIRVVNPGQVTPNNAPAVRQGEGNGQIPLSSKRVTPLQAMYVSALKKNAVGLTANLGVTSWAGALFSGQ